MIPVLFITYNRLAYTAHAFESIVRAPGVPVRVMVWDNGSTDGTHVWLKYASEHPAVDRVIAYGGNAGLAHAMNWFFRKHANAPYVVKVDNDTILPDGWLARLQEVMDYARANDKRLGAISGTCLRPNGWTFAEWVEKAMQTKPFVSAHGDQTVVHKLHFNEYVCGTGVLINMDMIRERGLLCDRMPCPISGWTDYTRDACINGNWKFAFHSGVPLRLLNLEREHVLSGDFPAYDAEMREMRDTGNAWWEAQGGLDGVLRFIAANGGHAPLEASTDALPAEAYTDGPGHPAYLTPCENREERATQDYWERRVAENSATKAPFLDTPQTRINAFTAIHEEFLRREIAGKDVLEVGCGWGRMTHAMRRLARSYVASDFIHPMLTIAKGSFPTTGFVQSNMRQLPFRDGQFDRVVAVTCVSSIDHGFNEAMAELKRVARPDGRVLLLEESWARVDWTLPPEVG